MVTEYILEVEGVVDMNKEIKIICSWHEITPEPQLNIEYSHGICEPCVEKYFPMVEGEELVLPRDELKI